MYWGGSFNRVNIASVSQPVCTFITLLFALIYVFPNYPVLIFLLSECNDTRAIRILQLFIRIITYSCQRRHIYKLSISEMHLPIRNGILFANQCYTSTYFLSQFHYRAASKTIKHIYINLAKQLLFGGTYLVYLVFSDVGNATHRTSRVRTSLFIEASAEFNWNESPRYAKCPTSISLVVIEDFET